MRGGKSNYRGRDNRHQNNRQGGGFFKPGEKDRQQQQARRHTLGPISLDFEDFHGSKKNDLPPGAQEFLTNPVPNSSIESTSETDVGISEYINVEDDGFDAIIKHRYSDFNVNEIDLEGNVVKLTSFEIPTDTSNRWVSSEDEKKNEEDREYPDYATLADEITPFVSQLSWCRITQLAKKFVGPEKPFDTEAIRIDVSEASKENRTSIHQTIKSAFPFLTSQTEDGPDGKKFIVVKFMTGQNDRTNNSWPKGRGKFLHFVLHKTDGDLAAIFSQVGDMMGSKSERGAAGRFKIAGLKDRRGRTSQWVSIGYTSAEKVRTLFRKTKSRAFVGNFIYKNQSLELGDLSGNHFSIVLRNVKNEARETVEKCLSTLEKKGFINYFGLQRFGTVPSVKTSDIGLAMIRSNWQQAIELILKPRPSEDQTLARTRAFWWMYRDAEHALKLLGSSPFGPLERKILVGLKESNPNDFVGALGFLPKNSRLLYIHSYQSLIWNQAVSKRFKQFGDSVVIGDLVLMSDSKETVQLDTVDKFLESEEEIKKESLKYQQIEERIVEVNEDNIKNFTIYDVVMPIPGWRVRVPSNPSLKSIYFELLEKDDLQGFETFRHKVDFYSLPGAYRKIVVKPWNFAYKLIEYNDPNQDLILSDLDLMWKKSLPEVEQSPNGTKFTAVILEMSLPSSTYATMALREAMKRDTSKSAQRSLTDAHNLKFGSKTGDESQGVGGIKREGDDQPEDPVKRVKTSNDRTC